MLEAVIPPQFAVTGQIVIGGPQTAVLGPTVLGNVGLPVPSVMPCASTAGQPDL